MPTFREWCLSIFFYKISGWKGERSKNKSAKDTAIKKNLLCVRGILCWPAWSKAAIAILAQIAGWESLHTALSEDSRTEPWQGHHERRYVMKNGCQRMPHPSSFPSTFNPGGAPGWTENCESETWETGNFLLSFWPECAEGENIECVGANSHPVCFLPVLFFLVLPERWSLSEGSTMMLANGNQKDQEQLIFLFRGTRKRSPADQRINTGNGESLLFSVFPFPPHCLLSSFSCDNCEESGRHKAPEKITF